MNTKNNNTDTLEISRVYKATREKVYEALTSAKIMAKWLNAGADGHAEVQSDCTVGGTYSVRMFDGSGQLVSHTLGEYLLIEPLHRISCTWVTPGFVEHSILTFEILDADDGIELVLKHQLPQALIEPHSHGWPNCLTLLEAVLENA
jgi:uncharacterized protein YndB with AHSA1/START domain